MPNGQRITQQTLFLIRIGRFAPVCARPTRLMSPFRYYVEQLRQLTALEPADEVSDLGDPHVVGGGRATPDRSAVLTMDRSFTIWNWAAPLCCGQRCKTAKFPSLPPHKKHEGQKHRRRRDQPQGRQADVHQAFRRFCAFQQRGDVPVQDIICCGVIRGFENAACGCWRESVGQTTWCAPFVRAKIF